MADTDREAEERLNGGSGDPDDLAPPPGGPSSRPSSLSLVSEELGEELGATPWAWPFHALLRQLERRHRGVPRFGVAHRLQDELPIRFGQDPSLSFPPAEIRSWRAQGDRPARVGELFFGLFGPNGPLPLHLSEFVIQRRRAHDDTLLAFVDVFHHRLLSLMHRAFVRARPVLESDRLDDNPFLDWIAALFGAHGDAYRSRDAVPDSDKLYFAGILANHSRHADGLEALVSEFFDCDAHVQEFVGEWIEVPATAQLVLGRGSRLGVDSTLGARYWSTQHKFRLVLGPLHYPAFRRLLPDGPDWAVLCGLMRNAVGLEIDWDVNLVLHRDDIPPLQLTDGRHLGEGQRLGWTTILPGQADDHFRRVCIDPRGL